MFLKNYIEMEQDCIRHETTAVFDRSSGRRILFLPIFLMWLVISTGFWGILNGCVTIGFQLLYDKKVCTSELAVLDKRYAINKKTLQEIEFLREKGSGGER